MMIQMIQQIHLLQQHQQIIQRKREVLIENIILVAIMKVLLKIDSEKTWTAITPKNMI